MNRTMIWMLAIVMTVPVILSTSVWRAVAEEKSVPGDGRLIVAVAEDGVQRVEITGGDYYFEPAHIVVRVNRPVEILARRAGGLVPHNIIVAAPEAGIDFDIGLEVGAKPIRFTPTGIGTFSMYCDKRLLWFRSHQEQGMEGVIEVIE